MTQEDDHRNPSGETPQVSADGGPPAPGAPHGGGDAKSWAAPGNGGAPGGFTAPGSDRGSAQGGAPGYGPPPGQAPWQTPPGQYPPPGYGHPAPPQAPKPGVVALRPMTLGDILNGAFTVVRRNPKTVVGLSLVIMAVSSIITSIGFSGSMTDYGTFLDQAVNDPMSISPDDEPPLSTWSLLTLYGGALTSYAGTILLTGLLTTVIGMSVLGYKLSPGQAWSAFRERIGPALGVAALQLLIGMLLSMVIVVLVFVGLFTGFAVAVTWDQGAGVAIILLSLAAGLGGLVLFLWIVIRLYFAMPVVILERVGAGRALGRSWELTRGSWWRIFGIILLSTVLIGVVTNLLGTPFSIISLVPVFLAPGELWAPVVAGAVIYVGNVLIYSVSTPFTAGVTTLLYVDLRMRREGLDLKLHTAALSGQAVGPEIYLPEQRA